VDRVRSGPKPMAFLGGVQFEKCRESGKNSSFAPPGLVPFPLLPQGLRPGLHSVAAPRLKSARSSTQIFNS
jgi:hypothetical protein